MNGKCVYAHARDESCNFGDKRGQQEVACMLRERGLFVAKSPYETIWMVEDEAILI